MDTQATFAFELAVTRRFNMLSKSARFNNYQANNQIKASPTTSPTDTVTTSPAASESERKSCDVVFQFRSPQDVELWDRVRVIVNQFDEDRIRGLEAVLVLQLLAAVPTQPLHTLYIYTHTYIYIYI
jgi:hypothetical protein